MTAPYPHTFRLAVVVCALLFAMDMANNPLSNLYALGVLSVLDMAVHFATRKRRRAMFDDAVLDHPVVRAQRWAIEKLEEENAMLKGSLKLSPFGSPYRTSDLRDAVDARPAPTSIPGEGQKYSG